MSYYYKKNKPAPSVHVGPIPASWFTKEPKMPEAVDHSKTTNLGPQLLNYLRNGTIALGNPNPNPNAGPRRVPLPVIPEDEWDPPSSDECDPPSNLGKSDFLLTTPRYRFS